jgi:hypothetical protein
LLQIRIRLSGPTVKELHKRLDRAYTLGDVRLVRRISALLSYLAQSLALTEVASHWSISRASMYNWLHGMCQRFETTRFGI